MGNMKTDNIVILNREHPDFKRLYWSTDKEKIKHILSRVNVKYLRGLIRQFIIPDNDWDTIATKDLRLFIRYDGYQFTVSEKTVIKEEPSPFDQMLDLAEILLEGRGVLALFTDIQDEIVGELSLQIDFIDGLHYGEDTSKIIRDALINGADKFSEKLIEFIKNNIS